MSNNLRLLAVLAHPDDESLGNGGMLARYAAEGVETYLITATRGEQGWFGDPAANPGPEALGKIREAELGEATAVLGIREVTLLDYLDGELARADRDEVVAKIAAEVRRIRPHVVVTFDPAGLYGHPDHIAICRLATDAVHAAADPVYARGRGAPYSVAKLYYMAWTDAEVEIYHEAFGELSMEVDGDIRRSAPWPDWAITTRIDAGAHWRTAWEAISCHRTQLPNYQKLLALPEEQHRALWGTPLYYRVFGPTPSGPGAEDDLFAGLRTAPRVTEVESITASLAIAGR